MPRGHGDGRNDPLMTGIIPKCLLMHSIIVTSSKALVTRSDALVSSSFLFVICKEFVFGWCARKLQQLSHWLPCVRFSPLRAP